MATIERLFNQPVRLASEPDAPDDDGADYSTVFLPL
jgi:hypothetical protein